MVVQEQTKRPPSFMRMAPGRSPASKSTWKPLQTPITGLPAAACWATASMIGERLAMAPLRK